MYKFFLYSSALFALSVSLILGFQVSALAKQIGTKGPAGYLNASSPILISDATRVAINGGVVEVEIAETPQERSKGLMYRNSLDEDKGMLFIFPVESVHQFWMKNTYIPLDIIWINSKMNVVHVESDVPPCEELVCPRYGPAKSAKYVLEVNAGWANRHKVKEGAIIQVH